MHKLRSHYTHYPLLLLATALLAACASTSPTKPAKMASEPAPMLVGGASAVALDDEGVQKAASFAAQQIGGGSVQAVIKAERQVVAGLNYYLTLKLSNNQTYEVVVYEKLDGSMQLTASTPVS